MNRRRLVVGGALMCATALAVAQCSSKPSSSEAAREDAASAPTPVLSVHELMEHMIDPTADWIFDAAVIDVSDKGTVETKPVSDEDWLKVERGLLQLAESMNLLKMPRPAASSREASSPAPGELSHAEVESKIGQNRALWNKYADGLRTVAVDSLKVVRARNAEGLFQVGNDIDTACENCHLEFWYPGDKAAVLANQKKKATFEPPKK